MKKEIKPLDWSKETTKENYCGYCMDYTCVCDGFCFTKDIDFQKNKAHHLKNEILKTRERLAQLRQESINMNKK